MAIEDAVRNVVAMAARPGRARVSSGHPLSFEVTDFLLDEAYLLDSERLEEWLELLADDVTYRMPTRATVMRADGNGFVGKMAHFDDDLKSLRLRVSRTLNTRTAWAEDPPTRSRRFVTNIRVLSDPGPEVEVSSSLLMLRSRWDSPDFEFLSCERRDVLRQMEGRLLLGSREILVDQSNLGVVNMSLFL